MSQQDKGRYYRALQAEGVEFSKHYRDYTTDELAAAYAKLMTAKGEPPHLPPEEVAPPQGLPADQVPPPMPAPLKPEPLRTPNDGFGESDPTAEAAFFGGELPPPPDVPVSNMPDPDELPGMRLNQGEEELEPIRTDEHGRVWYQEEVLKPGYAKPRGRRVLTYNDTGTEKVTVKSGDYTEEFEVAGRGPARASQVKVTLPSYQTGIYKHPNYPFKVHTYNGVEGFDFYEVAEFWHGADLVPEGVKRMYVENVLCWDIRTVVRQIEKEYRELQLAGRL